MTSPSRLLAIVACFAAPLTWAATVQVNGSVMDLGLSGAPKGIGGVSVTLKDRSQKELARTLTHPDGSYAVAVDEAQAPDAMLWFNKLGYVQRNAQRPVKDPAKPQSPVYLLNEDASPAATATNLASFGKTRSDVQYDTLFSAVSSLPPNKRQDVAAELKLQDAHLFGEFSKADRTYQAAAEFNARFKTLGFGDDAKTVKVYSNFGEPGAMRVYGAVDDDETRRKVEDAVKSLGKDNSVKNDIVINKVGALKSRQLDQIMRAAGG